MEHKRELILVIVILLLVVNTISFFTVFTITGKATVASTGEVSLCLAKLPSISPIADQTATVDTAFTLQVQTTFYGANTSTSYFDDTSLFNINQSGYLSFTPQAADVGSQNIIITVQDISMCSISVNSTETFLLTISQPATAAEEAAPAAAAAAGGGGGGGGVAKKKEKLVLSLSEETIKVTLKQFQKLIKKITVTNNGEVQLDVEVSNPLAAVLSLSPSFFALSPGESQDIWLVFNPFLSAEPEVYSGIITLHGTHGTQTVTKRATVVLEIESQEVLFDASIDIAKKTVVAGDELKVAINLFNLQAIAPAKVTLIHTLLDMDNNILYEVEETVSIDARASFSKSFPLAETLPPGQYLYSLKVIYLNSFASATELITVEKKPRFPALAGLAAPVAKRPFFVLAIPVMFVVIIGILVALYFTHHRIGKAKTTTIIKEKTIIGPKTIIKRDMSGFRRKLAVLKEGYQRGYITEEAYKKSKDKIEQIIEQER